MGETILHKSWTISAGELKRQMAADRAFKAERSDANGLIRYMAHADSYVMVRRPGCIPFVLSTKEWAALADQPKGEG